MAYGKIFRRKLQFTVKLNEYEKDKNNTIEVNTLLKEEMLKGYKNVLDNEIFSDLWKHWLHLLGKMENENNEQ